MLPEKMTYKKTLTILTTLATLALATWTMQLAFRSAPPTVEVAALVPDAFMEDVTAVFMDQQGRPSMKMMTPKLVHFIQEDTTQFIDPQLTLYHKSPKPWFINAKYAKATHGIENVNFWEDVTIHHVADENNPATLIKTPTLTVHPNQELAETQDMITLIQPNITVTAIGMIADMNTGNIKLLSQSQGEYVPNP
jgi:lipopolysaccharide export system protein LptC